MIKRIIVLALALAVFSSVSLANPQMCGPRSKMLEALKGGRFSEVIFATGKAGKDVIVEFFVNAETGTFTVLATRVLRRSENGFAGTSCIIGAGTEFQPQEPQDAPKPTKHTMLKFFQLQ